MKKSHQFLWRILTLLVIISGIKSAQAQSVSDSIHETYNYSKRLTCQGSIPKAISKVVKISPKEKSFNQFLRNMVLEGNVLYGTEINSYVERVADEILKNEPDLRSQLQFVILRSTAVNAYATEEGIIAINTGLLAQLSNESELAVVLAHEISHYAEHHIPEIRDFTDKLNKKDFIGHYLEYHNRSREQENEADRIGLERFFSSSNYSYDAVNRFFDVLLYSDLPFNEEIFDRKIVETSFYRFPDNYFLSSVAPISSREDQIDTLSTHPNLQHRRLAAQTFVSSRSNDGRSTFIQSEELFYHIRKLARYECIHIFLTRHEYDQALYNAHVLRTEYPQDGFLEQAMAQAIYGVSKYKNYSQTRGILLPYKEVKGEMQQTSYFLSRLSRSESSALALHFAWLGMQKYPENETFRMIAKDAAGDLFIKNRMKMSDFSDYAMDIDLASIIDEENSSQNRNDKGNKYDRISQKNSNQKVKPNEKFRTINYMLVDIHRNPQFIDFYNTIVKESEAKEVSKQLQRKGHPDVDRIVVLKPSFYQQANNNSDANKTILQEEKKLANISKQLLNSCKRLKIETFTYSAEEIAGFNTESYNEYSQFYQWFQEFNAAEGIDMVYHNAPYAKQWAIKNGYSKVCFVSESYGHDRFLYHTKWYFVAGGILCPYFLPASILNFSLPRQNIRISVRITDIMTGNTEMYDRYDITTSSGQSHANAAIYESLYHYKTGK